MSRRKIAAAKDENQRESLSLSGALSTTRAIAKPVDGRLLVK
jgi:hypothetical protein